MSSLENDVHKPIDLIPDAIVHGENHPLHDKRTQHPSSRLDAFAHATILFERKGPSNGRKSLNPR